MRLAIVEDDDKVRQQLQTYVLQYFQGRENDVDIHLFADGDEILEDYAADYDLIFLDIQMKRLDGLATAERIRERDEDVYLVFITNLANYAIRGYAVHALDFILKPVNFLMLRQVLMSVERLSAPNASRRSCKSLICTASAQTQKSNSRSVSSTKNRIYWSSSSLRSVPTKSGSAILHTSKSTTTGSTFV